MLAAIVGRARYAGRRGGRGRRRWWVDEQRPRAMDGEEPSELRERVLGVVTGNGADPRLERCGIGLDAARDLCARLVENRLVLLVGHGP
jgi:hypothetical protein